MTWRSRIRDEAQAVLIDWWEAMPDNHKITQDEIIKIACDLADSLPSPDERNGYVIVPVEPDTTMKRALLVHRGHDPDAKEETLDRLGQLDIATMGVFLDAYRAMVKAASETKGAEPMNGEQVPFGFIQDQGGHFVPDYAAVNDHCRSGLTSAVPAREIVRRMIYDGEKFVAFDGFEGAAILNKLFQAKG